MSDSLALTRIWERLSIATAFVVDAMQTADEKDVPGLIEKAGDEARKANLEIRQLLAGRGVK